MCVCVIHKIYTCFAVDGYKARGREPSIIGAHFSRRDFFRGPTRAQDYFSRCRGEDSWFFADLGRRKSGGQVFFLGLRPSPLYLLRLGPLPRNLVNAPLRPQTKAGMSRSRCLVTVGILETSFPASPG